MTAKETLVAALQEDGLGFTDACEHVQRVLDEFTASPDRERTYHSKTRSFVLRKMGPLFHCEEKQGETHEGESP